MLQLIQQYSDHLEQSSANFYKGPNSKYFSLCGTDGFCHNDSLLPLEWESSHR